MLIKIILPVFFLLLQLTSLHSQCLTLGADLSYVNTIEKNGGIYHDENGNVVDAYEYFAQRGADMVRMRLWHTPENITDFCGQPITANNLQDIIAAFQRAKAAGMKMNLAIHYGDYFNDPGKQKMPAAWMGLPHPVLIDSIYQYTYTVLNTLFLENIIPDIVAIGNETTWGFVDATETTDGWEWPSDAEKFNAGFNAVDAFNSDHNIAIKKAVHFTDKTAVWLAGLFAENNITNFDIIGISFYPIWSEFNSVQEFGGMIAELKNSHNKDIMVFETGAVWTTDYADSYNNIMNDFGNLNYAISPLGQRDFLFDLAQTVYENGGTGVLYWEPAYISSQMCTKWGQGSPYENVSFFNFNNNNRPLPAFDFFDFCETVNSVQNKEKPEIQIFPNPSNQKEIQIKSSLNLLSWQLIDTNGQIIEQANFDTTSNSSNIKINQHAQGVYFLKIKTAAGTSVIKKIKLSN